MVIPIAGLIVQDKFQIRLSGKLLHEVNRCRVESRSRQTGGALSIDHLRRNFPVQPGAELKKHISQPAESHTHTVFLLPYLIPLLLSQHPDHLLHKPFILNHCLARKSYTHTFFLSLQSLVMAAPSVLLFIILREAVICKVFGIVVK